MSLKKRINYPVIFVFFIVAISGNVYCMSGLSSGSMPQDSIITNQVLYNGRAWRNMFPAVKGDPYFLREDFLPGTVTINGKTFRDKFILYDINRDELIILTDKKFVLLLNKEMIERFSISWNNQVYRFLKLTKDSLSRLEGFVNELYDGKSAVYIKYRKTVEQRAVDGLYDGFVQSSRVYVKKDGIPILIKNKKQLLDLFGEKKAKVKQYIKSNRLMVSGKLPESFVPVTQYYDSISR